MGKLKSRVKRSWLIQRKIIRQVVQKRKELGTGLIWWIIAEISHYDWQYKISQQDQSLDTEGAILKNRSLKNLYLTSFD